MPRTFQSLTEVIHDMDRSRIHLGVHCKFDRKYGAQSGLKVAIVVYRQTYRRQGRGRYGGLRATGSDAMLCAASY